MGARLVPQVYLRQIMRLVRDRWRFPCPLPEIVAPICPSDSQQLGDDCPLCCGAVWGAARPASRHARRAPSKPIE
jgi:hypothetical protein